jgi:CRP/FNR family transcriptional regulator, anaerobic regulatory protein
LKQQDVTQFSLIFPSFASEPGLAEEILAFGTYKDFKSGVLMNSEAAACQAVGFILEGEVRIFKMGAAGREITLYEVMQGEACLLNASYIISGKSFPASAKALTDCRMLMLPTVVFKKLLEKYPFMREFVFKEVTERLMAVMSLIEEVVFGRMDERLMEYIIEKSEDNQLVSTHQKIADDLGSSREVISRLLKDLERKGDVILSRNLIRINNF